VTERDEEKVNTIFSLAWELGKVCRSPIMGKAFLAIRFNNKIINGYDDLLVS
jgi:hypothetical protein